jgi:hypothetical protein
MSLTRGVRERCIALAVLACGGGACDTSRERVAADSVPSAAAADTAEGPTQSASPLAAYPGFGRARDPDASRYRRQEIAKERYIAHCMHRAGFEYTPAPSVINPPAPSPPSSRPIDRYVASLSAERRTRYYLTLYGIPDPYDEENLWDPRSDTGGGCWGEAMRAIRSVYAAQGELMSQFLAMERSIARDPRVQAAERRWSECMRSRGFSYARPQSILAREDSAAIRRAHTPELERQSRQALEAAPACATAVGLDSVKAVVRVDKETEFVRTHKHVLDRHVERLRQQQPLVDSLLAQPQRD